MDKHLRQLLKDNDEEGIDDAVFEEECDHFFAVDWREDDASTVSYCAESLGIDSLKAEWREESLVIIYKGKETTVPLTQSHADRHITVCTLNDILHPKYEIRYLVCTHGDDTAGYAALPSKDWKDLDKKFPDAVAANFIRLNEIPNIFTELTEKKLPAAARKRLKRMAKRYESS